MKPVGIIRTAALLLLLGSTVPVWAQGKKNEEPAKSDKAAKGNSKAAAQPSRQQQAAPQARHEQQQQQQNQQQEQRGQQRQAQQEQRGRQQEQQQQRAEQQNANQQRQAQQDQRGRQQQQQQQRAEQQNANQQRQAQQEQRGRQQQEQNQQRADQQQNMNRQRQATQQQVMDRQNADRQRQATQQRAVDNRAVVVQQGQQDNRPRGWDQGNKVGWNGGTVPPGHQARLPQERQQQLITAQQARVVDYRRSLDQQRLLQVQWTTQQQRDRMTYYRYQQNYWARMRQQQLNMQQNYNWNNDPYFYTASDYSYSWGGNNYQTNSYGANMLRSAVNNGYSEGYRAGQADRQDRFGGGFQNSYPYQDANFGYNGRYVSQGDYNYYFRQGFDRGYQDGYNSRMQYGQYSNGNRSILGAVLGTILNLQSMR
ncbi:MAG: hypothetical protein M3O85_00255 [Acidobacteriota bacterium]|nr:hypothetical protein [Acidobacteriota bacterium]